MGNILIVGGKPKIADFEYAKRMGDDSKVHQARTVCDVLLQSLSGSLTASGRVPNVSCPSRSNHKSTCSRHKEGEKRPRTRPKPRFRQR